MILAELIRRAYSREGVVTAYIYGDFGYGKTSYALWTARHVLGSWDEALRHLVFSPEEAMDMMGRAVRSGERLPIIILDDAGLWLGKLTWWEEDKVAFMEFYNLVRSVAAGVIFTSAADDLPKSIRKKAFFRIEVAPASLGEVREAYAAAGISLEQAMRSLEEQGLDPRMWSRATIYKLKTLPSFMQYAKKRYVDYYPQQYPVYEEYTRRRREALRRAFENWRQRYRREAPEHPRRSREPLRALAQALMARGASRREVAQILVAHGIPRTTAYRWLREPRSRSA